MDSFPHVCPEQAVSISVAGAGKSSVRAGEAVPAPVAEAGETETARAEGIEMETAVKRAAIAKSPIGWRDARLRRLPTDRVERSELPKPVWLMVVIG